MEVIEGSISLPSSGQDLKKPSAMICQCPEHNTERLESSNAVASSGPVGADVESNGSGFIESHCSGVTESKDSGFVKT